MVEIAASCIALLVAVLAVCAWLASRDEQQRLQQTLAAQKQIISAAGVRERARDSSLKIALAQIDKLKRDTQTPSQIIHALPRYLPLPEPITISGQVNPSDSMTQHGTSASEKRLSPSNAAHPSLEDSPVPPMAQVPAVDLKSLYDSVQDYRACQLQLTAAHQDAADEVGKVTALTRERDAAITAAKGGGFWRRMRGNAMWFAIGIGAGYVARR